MAGNITITLAVNFGTALLFVGCLDVFEKSPGVGITDDFQAYQVFLIFLAITLLTHAISAFGNKWLPWLEVSYTFLDCIWRRSIEIFLEVDILFFILFFIHVPLFPSRVKPLTLYFFCVAHRLSPSSGRSLV